MNKRLIYCLANSDFQKIHPLSLSLLAGSIDVDKERGRSGTSATIASTASSSYASGNRVKPLLESFVDPAAEGQIVEMAHFTAGGQNLLSYVTTKGRLCGLDLRSNETVWRLTNNPKFG